MARIQVAVGEAEVRIEASEYGTYKQTGTYASYNPLALVQATVKALRAIDTRQSKEWADKIEQATGQQEQ